MSHASLERQLLAAQAAKTELENKLRQKEVYIEQLEGDRRFLTEREKTEREEKERERVAYAEDKVRALRCCVYLCPYTRVLEKRRGGFEVLARNYRYAQKR